MTPTDPKQDSTSDPLDLDDLLEDAQKNDDEDFADIPDDGTGGDDDDGGGGGGGATDAQVQIQDLEDQLARLQADYQNLLRRMRTEQEELGHFTKSRTIRSFLPIVDDLDRAFAHLPADLAEHEWVQGVVALSKNMSKILADSDVIEFDSIGQEVDPDKHDVISTGPGKESIVIAEIEKGYLIGESVLRHAKVVVGNGEEGS